MYLLMMTIVPFLIFLFIMFRIVRKKILPYLDSYTAQVSGNLNKIETLKNDLQKKLVEEQDHLEKLNYDLRKIDQDAREIIEKHSIELKNRTKKQLDQKRLYVIDEMNKMKKDTDDYIRDKLVSLTMKKIQTHLQDYSHEDLDKFLESNLQKLKIKKSQKH